MGLLVGYRCLSTWNDCLCKLHLYCYDVVGVRVVEEIEIRSPG
jgi:hypothetical protein